jgi:hypothetical protein
MSGQQARDDCVWMDVVNAIVTRSTHIDQTF